MKPMYLITFVHLGKMIPNDVNTNQFLKACRAVILRWVGGDTLVARTPPPPRTLPSFNQRVETMWATAEDGYC